MVSNSPVKSVTCLWLCVSPLIQNKRQGNYLSEWFFFIFTVCFLRSQVLDATLSPIQSQIHFFLKSSEYIPKHTLFSAKISYICIHGSIYLYKVHVHWIIYSFFIQMNVVAVFAIRPWSTNVPLVNTVSIYVIDRKLLLRGLDVRGHFYSVLIYFRRSVL